MMDWTAMTSWQRGRSRLVSRSWEAPSGYRLSDGQARSTVAAALLRQLWVVCVDRVPWEPAVAGGTAGKEVTDPAA